MIDIKNEYELKPCPFCGKNNLFLIVRSLPTERTPDMCHGCIWCDDCRVNGPTWTSSSLEWLKEDASKAWNKRTN